MPPPNITGILHLGHAYFATLQDALIRWRRMQGRTTLWLPGTDHAGLATQEKLDALMRAEGLDPAGPEFEDFAESYKTNLHSTISDQIRRIGASCDWSRERFTLDAGYSRAVTEALRRCSDQGMLSYHDGQWWLDMAGLAQRLLTRLDAGDLTIIPAFEEKTLRHFLENIEPWCISRQIKWGHRLPIWRHADAIWITDEQSNPEAIRETDVLDTWFSSALWPFATLGWPDQTDDLQRFYPADVLETGSDILFFWCARMLMMGLLLTDQLPFRTIFLHGLVRDENGEKMSKSKGNGIDPLTIINEYGTDALRIALLEDTTAGQDIRYQLSKVLAGRALCTKLWNAARFALHHYERMGKPPISKPNSDHADDMALLAELNATIALADSALEQFDFRGYALVMRQFIWDRFCSWYIEAAKDRLYGNDRAALDTLMWTLDTIVRLFHPMAPFITERISMAYRAERLITAEWPKSSVIWPLVDDNAFDGRRKYLYEHSQIH